MSRIPKAHGQGFPRETLIFLHVPKTAGNTMKNVLAHQYRRQSIHMLEKDFQFEPFSALDAKTRSTFAVIWGHMGFGIHRFVPVPSFYITFLREPVDRVVSAYYHSITRPDFPRYEEMIRDEITLDTYLTSGRFINADNMQTRMISGTGLGVPRGKCDRGMLDAAKNNLDQFFRFVGVTELFDATLMLMWKGLHWKLPFYLRQNVTERRPNIPDIDPKLRNKIATFNEFDMELYAYARRRLEEEMRRAGPMLRLQTNSFILANHGSLVRAAARAARDSLLPGA